MLEVMWVNTKGFTVGEDAQEVVERMAGQDLLVGGQDDSAAPDD